ncbi:hypothetical protein DCCM_0342 [Desulfocucumis palustris]|uniref:Uncharacterized protein n=1 Tax=Desulfocucumis palustris TaxID=1898651 RepID=A0A2L2XE93_9FIRM|nr:hypothetical protein DCCM_0342 [Desulfocucumis palustris]
METVHLKKAAVNLTTARCPDVAGGFDSRDRKRHNLSVSGKNNLSIPHGAARRK